MAFVNEYISEEDYEKYGLEALRWGEPLRALPGGGMCSRDWTIDRERNCYLRQFTTPHSLDDDMGQIGWTFLWHGELLWFVQEVIDFKGKRNGPQWSHIRISKLHMPPHLSTHLSEIQNDIREAFQAYAGGGMFSTATEFSQQVDFDLT